MFAHFDGVVAEKTADSIVLDVGGVGYLLMVSAQTLSLAPAVGGGMKLFATLSVREDAMDLFGFYSREEKKMYERLRTVSGIGPRTALSILSSMPLKDLSIALVAGDANALTRVPGIGKKTAQRLILELRDKVGEAELTGAPGISPIAQGAESEAIAALMALGYASSEAARAVSAVSGKTDKADEMIFLALKGLGG